MIDIDNNLKNSKTLNGVYETMSEIIGFDNVVKLYENFKGSQINFPTRLFSKEFVLQEALKSYDGTSESINLIATKYSYSERTIRKLLKSHINNLKWNERYYEDFANNSCYFDCSSVHLFKSKWSFIYKRTRWISCKIHSILHK